jgi:TRAP-type C4-dicarboxylate transport system permease small subunit
MVIDMKKVLNGMNKAGDVIDRVNCVLIALMMLGMFVVVMLNVIVRVAVGKSLPWSSELAPYLMVWASFLGSVVACKRKMHVAIDVLINALRGIPQKIVYGIMYLCILFALGILTYAGWIQTIVQMQQYSITMHFPIGFVYVSMPISGILMLYYTVLHMLEFYFEEGGKKDAVSI